MPFFTVGFIVGAVVCKTVRVLLKPYFEENERKEEDGSNSTDGSDAALHDTEEQRENTTLCEQTSSATTSITSSSSTDGSDTAAHGTEEQRENTTLCEQTSSATTSSSSTDDSDTAAHGTEEQRENTTLCEQTTSATTSITSSSSTDGSDTAAHGTEEQRENTTLCEQTTSATTSITSSSSTDGSDTAAHGTEEQRENTTLCEQTSSNASSSPDSDIDVSSDTMIEKDTVPFEVSDVLHSESTFYRVMEFIGEGTYGKVAKCIDLKSENLVAIKMYKRKDNSVFEHEINMLQAIRTFDPDKTNLVRFMDSFEFKDCSCLTFEMLDKSIWDLLKERHWTPLTLNEIRPIAHQLLVALKALNEIGIVHGDIKTDNIMLINHQKHPFRVKLIDFGLALPSSQLEVGMCLHSSGYQAPEILLGLPLTEAIDMWALGCVIAFLYFGKPLLPGNCYYQTMKVINQLLGTPEDHLLNAGRQSEFFFSWEQGSMNSGWRLNTPEEFKDLTGLEPWTSPWLYDNYTDLGAAVMKYTEPANFIERIDRIHFTVLLKRLLHMDAGRRITPPHALNDSFITGSHLEDVIAYKDDSINHMKVCPHYFSDQELANSTTRVSGTPDNLRAEAGFTGDSATACFTEKGTGEIARFNQYPSDTTTRNEEDFQMDSDIDMALETMTEKDKEKETGPFQLQRHDVLHSESTFYRVMEFKGEGVFGKVAKCIDLKSESLVAIKMYKRKENSMFQNEVNMLQAIRTLDPYKTNLVRFMDSFEFKGCYCLAFEMLDKSIWDLLEERQWTPLTLNEIRPIAHQLLVALKALKEIGIVHADIKTDNIMLVNHKNQPFRVKLIDFGLALPSSELEVGMCLQAAGYQAPEILLGLPLTEAIDMWALGCVIAFLYFGNHLLPGSCYYQTIKVINQLLGPPEDHLLSAGRNTIYFFSQEQGSMNSGWRFNTPDEFRDFTGLEPCTSHWLYDNYTDLGAAVMKYTEPANFIERIDRIHFTDLLKRLLHMDAGCRITPHHALNDSFITGSHLEDVIAYKDDSINHMKVCPHYSSDQELANSTTRVSGTPDNLRAEAGFTGDSDATACFTEKGRGEIARFNQYPSDTTTRNEEDFQMDSDIDMALETMTEKDKEKETGPFQLQRHDVLHSESTFYRVMEFKGEGVFGKVAKCIDLKSESLVAIKMYKRKENSMFQNEVNMLQAIRTLDPYKTNLVRFMDSFEFKGCYCLAFEMLDKSIWDLLEERQWTPLTVNEIRPIAHQLLVALKALKEIGIVHADIKTDNIMLVNHKNQPFRVKLIDFGLALPSSELEVGMCLQAAGYQAPEILLGLPLTEAIDMWALGCVIAFLYFGNHLLPGSCYYQTIKVINQLLGPPEDHLLSAGRNTIYFFSQEQGSMNSGWRFNTPDEFRDFTGLEPCTSHWLYDNYTDLGAAVMKYTEPANFIERIDRIHFTDLLKRLLHMDAGCRITPHHALNDSFITGSHLEDVIAYKDDSINHMKVCPHYSSDQELANSTTRVSGTPDNLRAEAGFTGDSDATACFTEKGRGEIARFNQYPSDTTTRNEEDFQMDSDIDMALETMTEKDKEKETGPFQLQRHDVLHSESTFYRVMEFKGEGVFGKVAKCIDLKSESLVAIKMYKRKENSMFQNEVNMLQAIRTLDPYKTNLVRFMDSFEFKGCYCLAFEMLDKSIWDLLEERQWTPLTVNEIRPIAHQLLVALKALKEIGIVHADIKTDNIMLVNHKNQPFRVKLIDFGLALPSSELEVGMCLQAAGYQAPEILLGLPLTEAIDMWALGCVIAFLYFGNHLLPGNCYYQTIKVINQLLGPPEDHLLSAGRNTIYFFSQEQGSMNLGWRFNTPDEFRDFTGLEPCTSHWLYDKYTDLGAAVMESREMVDHVAFKDRVVFRDLLKQLLHVNPAVRVTPSQALKDVFFTRPYMQDITSYLHDSKNHMTICQVHPDNQMTLGGHDHS